MKIDRLSTKLLPPLYLKERLLLMLPCIDQLVVNEGRMTAKRRIIAISVLLSIASGLAADWTTFAHDPERTGWTKEEKTLNPENVSKLGLLWKSKTDNQFYSLSALTPPILAANVPTARGSRNIVYVAGIAGTVFALDGESGEKLWSRSLRSMATPRKGGLQGTFLCPSGITATPVIDQETKLLYVIAGDGGLYGLELGSGKVKYGPVQFVAPFAKSWSLNVDDGRVYTTVSLGCGNGRSGVYAADIRDPRHPIVREVLLSGAYTAGIWGRGGAIIGGNGKIYGGTADGDTDPKSGDFSNTVVAISKQDLSIVDYFLPVDWEYLKKQDLDVGSTSPVWFAWRKRNLIAHGFKSGVIYLMDADNLGGTDHRTPLTSVRLGNDKEACCDGSGIWGALSTSRDEDGQTWLYVPMGGPPSSRGPKFPITNGNNPHGSIMAFKVTSNPESGNPDLEPAWISGDFRLPDPAVIANGVLFAISTGENADQRGDESRRFSDTHPAVLKALDAKTGRELYNSGNEIETWVHFSGLAVANGRVYAVDHDSNVYCFGLTKRVSVSQSETRMLPRVGEDELSASWIGRAERQDDLKRGWIERAGIALLLALGAAIIGSLAAMKRSRPSTRS
jgi:outer membrane protein assembly factor BamB